jgi:carboxymethylenebutenolidase
MKLRFRSPAFLAPQLVIAFLLTGVTTSALAASPIVEEKAISPASPQAPVPGSPQTVTFASGDETVSALIYLPATKGPHPAIVVIHEWWGVTDWVKQQAQDFANHGYISLVVDLYRCKSSLDPMVAHELMRGLPQDRALRDMKGAVTYLQSLKDVRKDRIGAVGWCMGGSLALQLALNDPSIRAVAINYGAPSTDKAQIAAMKADLLGNYGALDRGITPEDVHNFEATLKATGHHPDIKIYADAGHGFQNPINKDGYRPADTQDAHQRMLDFFAKTLDT